MGKKTVLFVGSFASVALDGSVGGQMYACRTLLESTLGNRYNWLLLDSTASTNLPIAFSARLIGAMKRLARFVNFLLRNKVDCCIIFTADGWSFVEKGTMSIVGKLARTKVVLCPRSGLVVNDVERSRLLKKFISLSIRVSDYVVCQGENWKTFYRSLSDGKESKFVVISNWLNISQYSVVEQSATNSAVQILYMSWVDQNKGIFDLVAVAEKLVTTDPDLRFVIAGSGAAICELGEAIDEKGLGENFELVGWATGTRKEELLSSSDIFVLPSYFEGYPNSIMEAMASGLAVVATNVGSIPELIRHEEDGMMFDPGDRSAFEKCLRELVSNKSLRSSLGRNAREKIARNNSVELAAEKFSNIIDCPVR